MSLAAVLLAASLTAAPVAQKPANLPIDADMGQEMVLTTKACAAQGQWLYTDKPVIIKAWANLLFGRIDDFQFLQTWHNQVDGPGGDSEDTSVRDFVWQCVGRRV